jgi:hypothetical protein
MCEDCFKDFLFMRGIILALSIFMFVVPALAEQTKPNVQLIKGENKVHFRFMVIIYEGIRTRGQKEERFGVFIKN